MKLFKLNMSGMAHFIAPLVVIVGFGVVGAYLVVQSHAATPSTSLVQCVKGAKNGTAIYTCKFAVPPAVPVAKAAASVVNGSGGTFYKASANYIYCQASGGEAYRTASGTRYQNRYWGFTISDQNHYGWVNAVYAHTGSNDQPYGYLSAGKWYNVPTCQGHGAAPGSVATTCSAGHWYTVGSGGGTTYYSCVGGIWKLTSCPSGWFAVSSTSTNGPCTTTPPTIPVSNGCTSSTPWKWNGTKTIIYTTSQAFSTKYCPSEFPHQAVSLVWSGGNLKIVYQYSSGTTATLWSTGKTGGYSLNFQTDGNIVIRDKSGKALWAAGGNTKTRSTAYASSIGYYIYQLNWSVLSNGPITLSESEVNPAAPILLWSVNTSWE